MDFTELRHLAEQIETECGKAIIGKGEQILKSRPRSCK